MHTRPPGRGRRGGRAGVRGGRTVRKRTGRFLLDGYDVTLLDLPGAYSITPTVVVVNMMDEAHRAGISIDPRARSEHLGAPVIPMVAGSGEGIE